MEVNNFLIELTSASISKGQPGLTMLFWLKRTSLSFHDFLKCKDISSQIRKIIIVCEITNSIPVWFAMISKGLFWELFFY